MKSLLACLALCFFTFAQAENQFSSWRQYTSGQLLSEEDSVSPGQKLTLGFDVRLEKKWHAYWVNPGDSGAPVKLSLSAKVGGKKLDLLTGAIQFPIPERLTTGPITSFVYNREVLYLADIVVPESLAVGDRLDLQLDAEWLVCSEVCIPAIDKFELSLPVKSAGEVKPSSDAEKFLTWRGRLPRMMTAAIGDTRDRSQAVLTFPIPADFRRFTFKDFFPLRGSQLSNAKPALVSQSPSELRVSESVHAVGDHRPDLTGLLTMTDGTTTVGLQWGDPSQGFISKTPTMEKTRPGSAAVSLVWILFSAFWGGLILNLMPCVFPILSIKLLSLVKQSGEDAHEIRMQNFSYTLGVTLSFLLIGLSLSVLRNAGALIGWGFQLQSPSFILFLVWLFFLLGMQLLGLYEIGWINGNVGGKWARREGNVGAFFTGVLAVVVASPCTAPFMGVALGFALSQSTPILLAVFICMGLGLSFPYVLFGVFPSWSRILPKPGVWMLRFKQVMAVPLLLTCVWLTWLLLQLKGEKGVGLAIAGMIALFLCVWIKTKKWQVPVAFGFLVLAGGVAAVRALPDVQAEARAGELNWEPFQESQMTWEQGPTIFIDFTADWCLTCKVNERLVFDRKDIVQFLKTNRVRLLKGDWTRQDPAITQFLSKYQRAGVPFYIAFGPKAPQGKILPEVLTPEVFKREMQAVMDVKEGDR